jgi:hypothetical protein
MERINFWPDCRFGVEQHFIRGIAGMTTRVGLPLRR